MSSVSVVVVIVGVVIAAIAAASLADGPKPATRGRRPGPTPPGQSDPEPFAPAFAPADPSGATASAGVATAAITPPAHHGVPAADAAPRPRRVRAMALLLGSIIALGTLAAGLVGATVLLGVRLLDRALG